ncbi:PhzF family phenazine biosynthesis protein [Paenibacillus aurantius]|uniref:PhzF family phenazine biosynthesis protein n=1 Tax=Paenibacillus aurantius TaxID=2918900 RepID=A0AA96LIP8_9BACL|nr:PhzF family phenazine biosynthesis protein [Paenibacillus aurantius]WNQ14074.1 PhzF family phenazine biosynthesis protein [Paenibacillus aurantius]
MSLTIYVVDAFSKQAFRGNPAAVCLTTDPLPDEQMQKIAQEMHLSETAFLVPVQEGFSLRWFTPLAEVELCGHATLASAHILWETGTLDPNRQAVFHTKSGRLTADRNGSWIELDFPAEEVERSDYPEELIEALAVEPVFVGRNRFDYFIEVESADLLCSLQPNFSLLAGIPTRGVNVTSRSDDYDFISRCFFPAIGVNEDPVTGSAHCGLAPYWGRLLQKTEMTAYQASSRGGVLKLSLRNDRVRIAGQAVTVMRSTLLV